MNDFKPFTTKEEEVLDRSWRCASVGDIISSYSVYQYIEHLHDHNDLAYGKIEGKISKSNEYVLKEIQIEEIDLEEWKIYEYKIDEYLEKSKEGDYPPIVVVESNLERYSIIDGIHRANSLSKLGHKTILAWVGIK